MKIGVFDSGIGGKAVAQRLAQLLPKAEIMCVDDHDHVPYGSRTNDEIISLTDAAIQPLLSAQCDAIVIACNTATTVAIDYLRVTYPDHYIIGIEPMLKPASQVTKSNIIAVLATPATLASASYKKLKNTWATQLAVFEPDTADWASTIESGQSAQVPIEDMVLQLMKDGVDVIVLACTHYHWLKERAEIAAGGHTLVLEPSDSIGSRIVELTTQ